MKKKKVSIVPTPGNVRPVVKIEKPTQAKDVVKGIDKKFAHVSID